MTLLLTGSREQFLSQGQTNRSGDSISNKIESADVPWSDAVVMVCSKCSRKIVGDEALADQFKKSLKSSFKESGLGKHVRTVTSSCLDICPKDRLAIAVIRRNAGTKAMTVDQNISDVDLFAEVKALAGL